jgi:hypothetical protein
MTVTRRREIIVVAMITSRLRALAVATLAFLSMTIVPVSATTLLNTITEPFIGHATNGYMLGAFGPASIGVAFNSVASNKITEIEAFMSTSTTAAVGMNFILMTDDGGLPGVQLFSKGFGLGVNSPVLLTSLDWTVTPGTAYWLIALPSPTTTAVWEFSQSLAGNIAVGFGTIPALLPEVRIEGELTAAVPEPSTWAMMLLGFAGIGYGVYRRKRMAAGTNATRASS